MEFPNGETIAKWTGAFLMGIVAVWKFIEKYFPKKEETGEVEQESVTRHLRRAEDSGLKIAVGELEKRMDRLEQRTDKRFVEERDFYIEQLARSEERISGQVSEVSKRLDEHYEGINGRLDILIKGTMK